MPSKGKDSLRYGVRVRDSLSLHRKSFNAGQVRVSIKNIIYSVLMLCFIDCIVLADRINRRHSLWCSEGWWFNVSLKNIKILQVWDLPKRSSQN